MTEESKNWELLQTLFHLAEVTPAYERERVLREHCSDPAIVERAKAIIRSSELLQETSSPPQEPQFPGRIGPYTLLRLIGSGGLGTVYLAERILGGTPQRVALKILAPHAAGPSFVVRFRREQHILGSLDHRHITRMLDAGLGESGQPYLVMEYVEGEHFDAYCDQRRLKIEDRLRLFLDVCDAVAYAHRNLIVHLDLKPSNILISKEGLAKLLDFGTSKLIETDGQFTTTVLATPAYASPEQLRNEPVTTACDVYALGVILFELLVGRRPYANSSVMAILERAAAEQQPESLLDCITAEGAQKRGVSEARLSQSLRGDLQTIGQKCLQPRPGERYASVDALAQDVRRYLDGEPVLARPQTALYRLGKFARRHRTALVAGATAAMLLIGIAGYAAWRQEQALLAARRAERMQTFMHQLFRMANSYYTGKPAVTLPEFLKLGIKMLPDYIRDPDDLLQAKIALAQSMYDNGVLTDSRSIFDEVSITARARKNADAEADAEAYAGQIAYTMGDTASGDKLTTEALQVSRSPGVSPAVRVRAADFYGWNHDFNGNYTEEDLRLMRFAADEARRADLPLHEKADAIHVLSNSLEYRGLLDESQRLDTEALALLQQDPASVCDQAEIFGELAEVEELKVDMQGALNLYQRSYDGYSNCSGADGPEAISMFGYLENVRIEIGQVREAVQALEHSRSAWEKVPDPYGRWAIFPVTLAKGYVATGRYKEAESLIDAVAKGKDLNNWQFFYLEYIWAKCLAGEQGYEEALIHAQNSVRDWGMVPKSIVVAPGGYRKFAGVHPLLDEIQAHLKAQHPAAPGHSGAS